MQGPTQLAARFRAGADDPVAALNRCLGAAEKGSADRAILRLVPQARADAEAASARFAAKKPLGPLDGVPIAVKDCIDIAGLPTSNGTRYLTAPALSDAPIVERLRAAGAVVFAKTNMHELGILPFGMNPHHGTPINPWDPRRMPGGSSSGSAVAVASGIAAAAIGTDAGGSVRVPAAFNGLVGLKPTFGAVPAEGVANLTVDLDHVGPIAWTVDDATLVFEAISGRQVARLADPGRVAVLPDLFLGADDDVTAAVRAAITRCFPGAGSVATPMCRHAPAVLSVIVGTDAHRLFADQLAHHGAELGADARLILQLGGGMSPADRRRADGVRAAMRAELDAAFAANDVLVCPATGCVAPVVDDVDRLGLLDMRLVARVAALSFVGNLTGLPSVVVPCVKSGLPIALQVLGRAGEEDRVLAAARLVEKAYGPRQPPRWHGAA